jgi:hypothetical protein
MNEKKIGLRNFLYNQSGNRVLMAPNVEACIEYRMRICKYTKTTVPTNTNVLITAGFVVACKLASARTSPRLWFL